MTPEVVTLIAAVGSDGDSDRCDGGGGSAARVQHQTRIISFEYLSIHFCHLSIQVKR